MHQRSNKLRRARDSRQEDQTMPYYVVDGSAVEYSGRRWVDNTRPARVMAEVVPIAMCDGDADGAPEFTALVPPEHAHVDDSRESDSKAI